MRAQKTIKERLADGIDIRGDCWVWNKSKTPAGYGRIGVDRKIKYAHRVSYEEYVGPIPKELKLDHLCRVRSCINPDHLEPVTQQENCRRGLTGRHNGDKTHCIQGHQFDEANTYNHRHKRKCRMCNKIRERRYRERKNR